MSVRRLGFSEKVLELVKTGITTVTATAGLAEIVVEVEHGLSERPVVEFMQSFDGVTYITRNPGVGETEHPAEILQAYTDRTKLYLHYFYATSTFPSNSTVYVNWRLYLTV